jgi:hypothetical protein
LIGGLLGLGVVAAILFWPKKASAASALSSSSSSTTGGGGGGGGLPPAPPPPKPVTPAPAPIPPVKGEVIIQAGSKVPLIAQLRAHYGGDFVTVPAGTVITIDRLEGDGTIWFTYMGTVLSSPVEEYTLSV